MKKTTTKISSLKDWTESRKNDPDYVASGLIVDLTEEISAVMEERKMNRSALAKKLKCSTAYITKLLRGEENLTIKKIAQIAIALELEPKISLDGRNQKVQISNEAFTVRFLSSEIFTPGNVFAVSFGVGGRVFGSWPIADNEITVPNQNHLTIKQNSIAHA